MMYLNPYCQQHRGCSDFAIQTGMLTPWDGGGYGSYGAGLLLQLPNSMVL